MESKCKNCFKKFNHPRCRKGIFCSHTCYSKFNCGKSNYNWRGGRYKSLGYWYVRCPKDNPGITKNGYIREHRIVMEKKICRYLTKDEHIHHINGIKDDNRIENLIIIHESEHRELHSYRAKNIKCIYCDNIPIARNMCMKHYDRWRGPSYKRKSKHN